MIAIDGTWSDPEESVYVSFVPVDGKIEQGPPIKYYQFDYPECIEFYLESQPNELTRCVMENRGYGRIYIRDQVNRTQWVVSSGEKAIVTFANGKWWRS